MGKLIYSITTSLDGYVCDKNDNFDWAAPSEEELACVNNNLRNVGTFLFGRKMYDVMKAWDTIPTDGKSAGVNQFGKIWRAANKIIYSTSLSEVETVNTTLERKFDLGVVRKNVLESDEDFNIGGPHLAAQAIKAGIIDEYHQYIVPVVIGDGTHWLPHNVTAELELMIVEKFESGTVHLHYNKKS